MLNMKKYQTMEAIEDLLDDYDLAIANLDADMALKELRIGLTEAKLKSRKSANIKRFGYLRIMAFREAIHFSAMRRLIYRHYQDGLHERLRNIKRSK